MTGGPNEPTTPLGGGAPREDLERRQQAGMLEITQEETPAVWITVAPQAKVEKAPWAVARLSPREVDNPPQEAEAECPGIASV